MSFLGARLPTRSSLYPACGQGRVYRAKDRRLGREVAFNILAPHLAVDADRRAQ